MSARHEVHLRVLTGEDAAWAVRLDESATTTYARTHDWDDEKLAAELDEGVWASDDRFAWAIVVDGEPGGLALVTGLSRPDADMDIRISPHLRGRGVGREVLRQLADHHFAASHHLVRLAGRAHEDNVPMQRAFNAAGFRMEARYRDSFLQTDGDLASEWGYALTRGDWRAGRHRGDEHGYDLHGLSFAVEETTSGPPAHGMLIKFLQEGRRAIARYDGHEISEGELAGVLVGDVLTYHFVHLIDHKGEAPDQVVGHGRARIQRRGDGRLEAVDEWDTPAGLTGRRVLVERRDAQR
ncbi:GNAT family N-acetyltransferase [Nitriliruptor alkaliphilus]|uniref:GNAT family N-acetyltransferase n=1 Tax=Nitriliruptor alkaliphilus TaxID=427918 RepID=UPI000695CE9F|nr:GNAT family protein [Nitriliruptor alkaliphilus]